MAIQPLNPVLSTQEILTLARKRVHEPTFQMRDAIYEVLRLYYYGETPSDGTVEILAANSIGRPLLRDLENYKARAKIYSSQRLSPIVDDYQALLGRMPNSRVEVPDGSPQGEAQGEKLTKYLISTHEISDMDRQQQDAGFHLPALGDTCYVFTPNGDKSSNDYCRIVWEVVNPRSAYPSFYRGHRRFQIYDLVIRAWESPELIKREWGITVKSEKEEDCLVTTYISPYQRTVVVGDHARAERPIHAEWDLGFCPAQWVYNKVNGAFAQSDISHSLAQQDFLDFAWNILIDGMVRNVYGTIIGIKNPQNMGQEQIVLGPNPPPVLLQDDGAITATQVGGDINPAMQMIQQAQQDMNATSGTSQVRQEGQMHGSIQTGRAIHAAQGPQSTRIELKQSNLGAAIRNANTMTLAMQEKAPGIGKHKFEIYGRYNGKSFREEMTGEEIDGWYRNNVTWDAMMGLNPQQKAAIAAEGKQFGLWSSTRAIEITGLVDDPIEEMKRIETDKIRLAGIEARVQAAMSGQGQQQAGGQQAGGGPQAPLTPPSSGSQPAPMIARPFGMSQAGAQPPMGGGPAGVSVKTVQTALATVASKLKGTVFAVGDLALSGQSVAPKLMVSEWKDQPLVMQTLKPLAPKVQVSAAGEKDMPTEAVRVA